MEAACFRSRTTLTQNSMPKHVGFYKMAAGLTVKINCINAVKKKKRRLMPEGHTYQYIPTYT